MFILLSSSRSFDFAFSVVHLSLSLGFSHTLLLPILFLLSLSSALSLQFYFVYWSSVFVSVSFRLSKWVSKKNLAKNRVLRLAVIESKTILKCSLLLSLSPSAWLMLFLSGTSISWISDHPPNSRISTNKIAAYYELNSIQTPVNRTWLHLHVVVRWCCCCLLFIHSFILALHSRCCIAQTEERIEKKSDRLSVNARLHCSTSFLHLQCISEKWVENWNERQKTQQQKHTLSLYSISESDLI